MVLNPVLVGEVVEGICNQINQGGLSKYLHGKAIM